MRIYMIHLFVYFCRSSSFMPKFLVSFLLYHAATRITFMLVLVVIYRFILVYWHICRLSYVLFTCPVAFIKAHISHCCVMISVVDSEVVDWFWVHPFIVTTFNSIMRIRRGGRLPTLPELLLIIIWQTNCHKSR